MSSPHYKPGPDALKSPLVSKVHAPSRIGTLEGDKLIIKPRALEIKWGGHTRYWCIPGPANPIDPIELLLVSWLEVSGSIDLHYLEKGQDYKLSFKLRLKPDAFGWSDSPIYFMAKPGKNGAYSWKKCDSSLWKPGEIFEVPQNPVLKFTVPRDAAMDDKLHFGMYEIWKGSWKGGLVIHEVIIEPFRTPLDNSIIHRFTGWTPLYSSS